MVWANTLLAECENTGKPSKAEVMQRTKKLQMPFIANEGQYDERVAFYARTFGGTVFVTKGGDIVYSLPMVAHASSFVHNELNKDKTGLTGYRGKEGQCIVHRTLCTMYPYCTWNFPVYCSETNSHVCHSERSEEFYLNNSQSESLGWVEQGETKRAASVETQDLASLTHSPNVISPLKIGTHPVIPSREGNGVCNTTSIPNDKNETHPRPLLLEGSIGIALREEFVGAKVSGIKGEGESVTKVSYFKGNDPSKWKTNIATYEVVTLGEVYDGIELKLKAHGNNVEKLLYVKPGADPNQIKISLSGLQPSENPPPLSPSVRGTGGCPPPAGAGGGLGARHGLEASLPVRVSTQTGGLGVNDHGELVAETELGPVKFTKPVAYQEIDGKRVDVAVEYSIQNPEDVGWVKQSAPNKNGLNQSNGLEASGKRQIISGEKGMGRKGKHLAANLKPPTSNPKSAIVRLSNHDEVQNPKSEYGFKVASYDKTKELVIDPLLASTFLGNGGDTGYSIAIDSGGNIYVAGFTYSIGFPITAGAYNTNNNGGEDVFVSKLNGDLTSLLASTYLGGQSSDSPRVTSALAIDSSGNLYVAGLTYSPDFPTTPGAFDTSFNGDNDTFVSKLNGNLTNLLASTFLGGSDFEEFGAIAIDPGGNIYVSGRTFSSNFPISAGAYDIFYNNGGDAFISRLNGDLTNLLASTYLGGGYDDICYSIAIVSNENLYIAGYTYSEDFPTTAGAYDTSFNSVDSSYPDVFISKINGDLTNLLSSTYLGGSLSDVAIIFPGSNGDVYVVGTTLSSNFPTTPGAYDTSYNGGDYDIDIFLSRLSGDLTSLIASTYLGGSSLDTFYAIGAMAMDSYSNVYVFGVTSSPDFPTTPGAFDTSFNGDIDTFVSKFNGNLTNLLASTYLGGTSRDEAYGMTRDSDGNVYVFGTTSSSNFPTTPGAYDTSNKPGCTFVSKFDRNLSLLETTPPTVNSTNPANNATNIAIGSSITATFSEALDADTINTATFIVDGGSNNISGVVSYNGTTATFAPLAHLVHATTYTARITTGVTDLAGNAITSDYTWSFTTPLLTVPYVIPKITVDGNVSEGAWDIATDVSKVVIGTANNTAKFGVLWDSTYLYVGMKVLDDTLYNDSTFVHEDDSVEIYIDGDHNHGTTYDSYDRQFVKGWFDSALVEQHGKTTGVLHGWSPIPGGYSIELAIPWSNLGITPTEGMTLGFSVGYNDDDNGGGRDGQTIWWGTANNWLDTSALGDIVLGADPNIITVPYTSTNLTVDGNVTETDWNIATAINKVVIGTANNTTKFGVLWDTTYLYVGMKVLDDTLYNDSTYVHEDDSVEVYIDGDHNHGTTYDSYDRQFVKGWFDSTLVEQHGKTTGVLHGWAPISGGYSIELAIPWSNLGITPTEGMTLGFSVGYNDDDNGAGRDGQAVWIGTANNYLDTSAFGSIILGAASSPIPTPTPTSTSTPPLPTPTYTPTNTPTPTPPPTPIVTPSLTLTPTPTPLPGGLKALYTFNEGGGAIANDSSGNGNHGTINGATWTTGISGGALSLDGFNDYVDLGNPANLQPGTVSLSVWFKTTATGGRIIRKRTYGYGLDVLPTGKISFWINNAAAARFTATSPNAYNDNTWHHAVGVYGGSLVKLYMDGLPVASASAGAIFYGAGAIAIGRDGDYNGSYFKGLVDDVRIFQSELSDQAVLDLYNQSSSGLVSLWKFDEGIGTIANDWVDGNNGAINGGTWTTGKSGGALSLDGNDYVQIPGLLGQPKNITLSAWVQLNAKDTLGAEVISLGDHVTTRFDSSNGAKGFYYDGTTWHGTDTGLSYAGTGWHHVVYVVDDNNNIQKVYIDGIEKGSTVHTQSISYTGLGSNTFIGRHGNGGSNYDFAGIIDDVRVYNKALNAQEVQGLYNNVSALVATTSHGFMDMNDGDTFTTVTPPGMATPIHPATVALRSFKTEGDDGRVTLTWETSGETDNAGFNLYRARRRNGTYTQVNNVLIDAKGDATSGGSYSFEDQPGNGNFYYYKLESVDYDGVSTVHKPVKVKARSEDNPKRRSRRHRP
jgi:hypothetical protein